MFKKRSKLGIWLDERGITQKWLSVNSKVNKNTITELCNNPEYAPTLQTVRKILIALKKIDPNVKIDDFWNI